MKGKLEFLLEQQILDLQNQVVGTTNETLRIHIGGRIEQARLTILALRRSLTGNPRDMQAALNGETTE